ncbi:hypothetical protein AOQ84DRAFT_373498 [Glonium stellatum]|uniref:Uncharacterized protein n=1 Tax=Glonium stellatum TaxID=574774 RepID=A0A8E2JWA2_9PEZI|nr:hypothetical protein AOQ84DRAFT_373498 [Glonium stellatum]
MLLELSTELLLEIVRKITNKADISRLCQVSKRLCQVSLPLLYESLTFSATELSLESLVSTAEKIPLIHLKYTKDISIRAPFRTRLWNRCLHRDDPRLSDEAVLRRVVNDVEDDEVSDRNPFFRAMMVLDVLFCCLAENKLRSFSWDLGTCIPEELLWGDDSLLKRQTRIENVSLITDGACGTNIETQYFVDLAPLTHIRSLSWRGLNRYDDFDAVRKCLKLNGNGIKVLSLDLIDWDKAEHTWFEDYRSRVRGPISIPDNFFTRKVLEVTPGEKTALLPSLEVLSVCALSFQSAVKEMTCSFNMRKLHTLKLWNCAHSLDLLLAIIENETETVKYKSFELVIDSHIIWDQGDHTDAAVPVATFLSAFQGLEDLYLMLPQSSDWDTIVQGILCHKSTLRRLTIDDQNAGEGTLACQIDFNQLFQDTYLRCIGMSAPVYQLRGERERHLLPPTCKILHIRTKPMGSDYDPANHSDSLSDGSVSSIDPTSPDSVLSAFDDNFPNVRQATNRDSSASEVSTSANEPLERDSEATVRRPASSAVEMEMSSVVTNGMRLAARPLKDEAGQEILEFARWASSLDGLPNLQVIAWGNFSYEGRYASRMPYRTNHEMRTSGAKETVEIREVELHGYGGVGGMKCGVVAKVFS